MENNKTSVLLNEGALQKFISSIFGRNFKSTIGAAAEGLLNKALNDVVKSGRKFSINTLRKTPEYAQALKQLTEEACRVKHKMSFDDLVKFNKNEAQKLIDDVQAGMTKQLEETAATTKGLATADVKAAKGNVKNATKDAKSTLDDVRGANKDLLNATKLESAWSETQKAISKMDKIKLSKVQKIISQEAKVTTGTGSSIAKTVGNNVVIKTVKGIFKTTKEGLKKFPGKIKKVVVNNPIKSALAVAGLGATALYYFYKSTDDTSIVLVDENGNPVEDTSKTNDWGPCLTSMLKNKQAQIGKSKLGEISVVTPPSDKYPNGLLFYPNGRVMNPQNRDKGTWTCTAGQAQTNENMGKTQVNESLSQIVKRVLNERYLMEQSDAEIDKDVNKMIDFLDWPVSQSNLQNAYNLLVRYSTSPKVKEFLHYYEKSGLVNTSLSTTLSMIFTREPGSVRLKEKLIALLDQIESGTVKPIQTNTNQQQQQQLPRKVNIIGEQSEESDLKIVWDKDRKSGSGGGNTGGGGGGTTRRTYYDCSSVNIETTPLTYGCKDTKIGEIQGCLGLTVDNKFGPNTRKELKNKGHDITNGITKAIYDKVKANCSQTASTQTYADNSAALTSDYMKRNPIKMDLGPVPQMPTKNTSASGASASEGMTDAQYYTSLIDAGLFNATGIIGRTAYNGPALEPSEKQKLDRVLDSMKYAPDTVTATDKGARYVWQKK
jgi:hypothetical protein